MADPDYVYDPDDWECTYNWEDREMAVEDSLSGPGDIKKVATLLEGPLKFAANVPTSWEDGEPQEWEVRWFDTIEDARAACRPPAEQRVVA